MVVPATIVLPVGGEVFRSENRVHAKGAKVPKCSALSVVPQPLTT